MSVAKEEARKVLESVPDNATWEDIMYQLYLREKVEAAIAEADAGEGISQEEMEKRFPLP
jgi:hypothetical protein